MRLLGPRAIKELRTVGWTWLATLVCVLLPLLAHSNSLLRLAGGLGSFLGVALLAAIPIGSEFADGTIGLLLSQPLSRSAIWRDKLITTLIALGTVLIAFSVASLAPSDSPLKYFMLGWIVFAASSGCALAVATQSIVAGAVLNLCLYLWITALLDISMERLGVPFPVACATIVAWSALMLWLSYRQIADLQITAGAASKDLVTTLPRLRFFRCQPHGIVGNFIKKELGLLRPLWLITGLLTLAWPIMSVTNSAAPLLAGYWTLAPLLAGLLTVSEERMSGMHQWHLTLPMPAVQQWALKAVVAVSSGIVCAFAIPALLHMVSRGAFHRVNWPGEEPTSALLLILIVLGTLAAFWSACATKESVRAILLTSALFPTVTAAYNVGNKISRMPGIFTNPTAATGVLVIVVVGLIQSYRMFVRQPASAVRVLANLSTLAAVALVVGLI